MPSPLILSDFACVPPCKKCKDAGECADVHSIVPESPLPPMSPREYDNVPLKCGCSIPWPVISLLGTGGKQVYCDTHGYQSVTKGDIAKSTARLKKAAKPDATEILDIPPF